MSQLDLAAAAEVSQRHVSFLETGRSKPSPEMVVHLGRVLDLPLREQNRLLTAAGFAPAFAERGMDDPDLDQVRGVLHRLLDAYGPYPAYVIDRGWDLVMANPIAGWLIGQLDPAPPPEVQANVMRLTAHPDGLRARTVAWETTVRAMLYRLERELAHSPGNDRLRALRDEVMAYPGLPDLPVRAGLPAGDELVLSLTFTFDGGPEGPNQLRFFSTVTTIGAAFDITLEELRLETLLPADAATEQVLRSVAADL